MKKRLPLNLSLGRRRWIAIIVPLCWTLINQYAVAAPGDTISATAGSMFMYDNNVFRLSPTVDPVALTGQPRKSDQIIITTATLTLDKTYLMQRFEVTGRLVDNRYMNFDYLDFLGKNYNAAWHWYVTP